MRTFTCITPVLAGAGLAACGTPEQPAVSTSFELTAELSFSGKGPYGMAYPDSESFLLHLEDAPDGTVAAIWTAAIDAGEGTFDRTDTGLSMREPLELDLALGPMYLDLLDPWITVESLRLVLVDKDGDGDADAVKGSGSGTFSYAYGDVPYEESFTITLRGDRDVTPPEIYVVGNEDNLPVLNGLRIQASEPLLPGSTARAWLGDTRIDLTPVPANGTYVRFFSNRAVLPFDAELRIELDPVPQDLVGLAAESVPMTVRTTSGLDLFAEDGFEGEPAAVIGGAKVVTGVGTLPAIAGARSLLVEPEDALTMRIPVTAGDTHLRFRVRRLYETDRGCESHGIRVGSPGLIELQGIFPEFKYENPDAPDEDIDDASWGVAGPIAEAEVALPPGTAGELVFDLYALPPVQPPCPFTALLIDDLRVE